MNKSAILLLLILVGVGTSEAAPPTTSEPSNPVASAAANVQREKPRILRSRC